MENFETENIKLYGKDTAISCAYTLHKREDKVQWNKIVIEWTKDLWKTKTSIMIEDKEIFELLWVLYWYQNEIEVKRKSEKEAKSIKIWKNKETWDFLIKVDSSIKWKIIIKLDNLNRLILTKISENTLIKEIERVNFIKLSVNDLKDFIQNNIQKSIINEDNIKNDIIQGEDNKHSKNTVKVSFINTYNWKDFENYTNVENNEENIKILKSWNIENIKKLCWKNFNFLNDKNINTLKF